MAAPLRVRPMPGEAGGAVPARGLAREWRSRAGRTVPWAVLVLGAALPLIFGSGYELARWELLLLYVTIAIALNFAFGYAGELALGQPVLVAVSAYTAGLLSSKLGWQVTQTVLPAIAAAIVASVVLALPGLRVRGWYYAVISFFAIAVMPDVLEAFAPLTGGSSGLVGINPMQVGDTILPGWAVYEVILATAALSWVATRSLVTSGWGIILRGVRDHPVATASSGVNLQLTRAWVYVLLAIPCGLAGVEYAHSQLYLTPSNFAFNMILLLIGGVFLGGRGTLWGPLIGISIFEGITFWIGPFSGLNQLLLGAGVLVAAVGFRGGVVATAHRWLDRLRRPRMASDVAIGLEAGQPVELPRLEGAAGLAVHGVSKSFGGNQALRSVDLEVRAGRVLALIGPNGSGKTTLLNVVSGFVSRDAGRITLNGRDVADATPHRIARMGLGRTFQVPRLIDELSVAQNVELGILGADQQRVLGSLLSTPWERSRERDRRRRAGQVCRFLGFSDSVMDMRAGSLPLGLKRIVEIGRAIASDAPVVCLDEPAAGLNGAERLRLAAVLRGLAGAGRAVLLIEHNTRFVLDVCDDVVLLEDGAVAASGNPGAERVMEPRLREYVAAYRI